VDCGGTAGTARAAALAASGAFSGGTLADAAAGLGVGKAAGFSMRRDQLAQRVLHGA
jgi:hypothetical protein